MDTDICSHCRGQLTKLQKINASKAVGSASDVEIFEYPLKDAMVLNMPPIPNIENYPDMNSEIFKYPLQERDCM